ncbi:cytochrome P450 (plasmid) [Streptomyces sp. BI20]|uniref:cytochrome P450 n=1 Tax=Streptomyces sp. BI20 TaxID=3403460 RepID=UPI003C789A93
MPASPEQPARPAPARPAPGRSPLGPAFLARPEPLLDELRERCPVAPVTTPAGNRVWLVTRDAAVRAGFLDPRLSLHTPKPPPDRPHRAGDTSLVHRDGPDHLRIRRLAGPALAPARVARLRPRVEALAHTRLTALGRPDTLDLLGAFAEPFAFDVLCAAFGIPDADAPRLHAAVRDLLAHRLVDPALNTLDALIRALVARAEAGAAAPGVITDVHAAWREAGNVTADELVDLLAMLVLAGFDATVQMVGLAVRTLLDRPHLADRLRTDPAATGAVIEELLRRDTPAPFATRRIATADLTIDGTAVPRGSSVLLAITGANRDPRRHPEPDTDPHADPRTGPAASARPHLTFGAGPHFCPGAALARLELAVALPALLAHWPRLRPACPADRLRWTGGFQHRRLTALPVHPDPAP